MIQINFTNINNNSTTFIPDYISQNHQFTDIELITNYCTFFNQDIYRQILILLIILILIEIVYLLSKISINNNNNSNNNNNNNNNSINILVKYRIYENLKTGFEIAIGFFLIIHSFDSLLVLKIINISDIMNNISIVTYITKTILCVSIIAVAISIYLFLKTKL